MHNYFPTLSNSAINSTDIKYRLINDLSIVVLRGMLSEFDFSYACTAENFDDAFNYLYNSIYELYEKACPIKTKTISKKRWKKPWITNEIIQNIKQRNAYYVLWKSNRIPEQIYKRYRNYVVGKLRQSKQQYCVDKFNEIRGDMKQTGKVINNILNKNGKNHKREIHSIICNGETYTDELEIANKFNEYFVNAGRNVTSGIVQNNTNPLSFMRGSFQNSFFFLICMCKRN